MTNDVFRIEEVSVTGPGTLRVKWHGKEPLVDVNLTNWIVTGGEVLAALNTRDIFVQAAVGNHGSAVLWNEGDIAIDAMHLMMLANEQKFSGLK